MEKSNPIPSPIYSKKIMAKYFKTFETTSEWEDFLNYNLGTVYFPATGLIKSDNTPRFSDRYIYIDYNIETTSAATHLVNKSVSSNNNGITEIVEFVSPTEMKVLIRGNDQGDGVLDAIQEFDYKFSTTGIHHLALAMKSRNQIASGAFSGITTIKNVIFAGPATSMPSNMFKECSEMEYFKITNPNLVSLAGNCFVNCTNLKYCDLLNAKLTGANTFQNCAALRTIKVPEGTVNLGANTFNGCGSLTEIILPDSLTGATGQTIFAGCSSLETMIFPAAVTKFATSTIFRYCTNLKNIICLSTTAPTIGTSTFRYMQTYGTLTYPAGADYSAWLSEEQYYLGFYNWTPNPV